MKIPRFLTQTITTSVSVAGWTTLDSSQYRNDGDHPLFIEHFIINADSSFYNPRLIVAPTNAPQWSRVAVPATIFQDSKAAAINSNSPWILKYPIVLNPHDGLGMSVYNTNTPADPTISLAVTAFGYKDTSLVVAPASYWSPRILFSEVLTVSNGATFTFPAEDLTNWDANEMVATDFIMNVMDGAAQPDGVIFTGVDQARFRLSLGQQQWTTKGIRAAGGALFNSSTAKIAIPYVKVAPGQAFSVEAMNNTGAAADFHAAVIGYMRVNRC